MEKKLQSSLKTLVKTSMAVFIGIALSKILSYVYRVLIARYYGPEVYGLFSIAVMISGWFLAICALGVFDGLIRFIPLYRGKNEISKIKYLIKFSSTLLMITSLCTASIMFFMANFISMKFFHNSDLTFYIKVFSILIPLTTLSSIFLALLRSFEEIQWYSFIFNVLQNVSKILFLGIFIWAGVGKSAVPVSYLIAILIVFISAYLVSRYKLPEVFGINNISNKRASIVKKEVLKYSLPLVFFGIISTIFYWIDSFSIGYYRGATEVGIYNAAVPIATLLLIASEIFMQLFFPMITKEYSKGNIKLIAQLSKQVSKWILIVNIPLFAILIVFPGAAINLFFGEQYTIAKEALRILSLGAIISSVLIVPNNLISMIGKSKLILTNIIIAAIINFVLNAIFIPMDKIGFLNNDYGLVGAALATLIAMSTFNLLFVLQTYKYIKIIPLRRKMINLFLIALIPTGILFYLRTIFTSNNYIVLFILIAIFIIIYAFLILITNSLDKNDWNIINSIKKKYLVNRI